MSSEAIIPFKLELGLGQIGRLVYRPWSTRTLKIRVTTAAEKSSLPPLRIRPQRRADKIASGITAGYADDSDFFVISWGGGHEDGPCIKASDDGHVEGCISLTSEMSSNIFFNITHIGSEAPAAASLTLEAYEDANPANVVASLTVSLEKPAELPADVMHLVQNGDQWTVQGGSLPVYDPRWFPLDEVAYRPSPPPPLTIQRQKTDLHVFWEGKPEPIILIEDATRPALVTLEDATKFAPGGCWLELLDWDEEYFILRVWFAWLNLNIGVHELKAGLIKKELIHEVPDAERFDFMIRRKNGKVALACTDLHWREMWGQVTRLPVKGEMGLTAGSLLAQGYRHAWEKVREKLVGSHEKLPYHPYFVEFLQLTASDMAEQDDAEERRKLLSPGLQAHVPTLSNVELDPELTSVDVRTGK